MILKRVKCLKSQTGLRLDGVCCVLCCVLCCVVDSFDGSQHKNSVGVRVSCRKVRLQALLMLRALEKAPDLTR